MRSRPKQPNPTTNPKPPQNKNTQVRCRRLPVGGRMRRPDALGRRLSDPRARRRGGEWGAEREVCVCGMWVGGVWRVKGGVARMEKQKTKNEGKTLYLCTYAHTHQYSRTSSTCYFAREDVPTVVAKARMYRFVLKIYICWYVYRVVHLYLYIYMDVYTCVRFYI